MTMQSEKHASPAGNLAKLVTIAVIVAGLALVVAVFIYTV
jgi:hypothetical protein